MTEKRLPPQSEKSLQADICEFLACQGWEVFEFARVGARVRCERCGTWAGSVRGNPVGWPDVVAVKRGQHVYLEVKARRGVISHAQKIMRMRMQVAGMRAYVVRAIEDVMEVLRDLGYPVYVAGRG